MLGFIEIGLARMRRGMPTVRGAKLEIDFIARRTGDSYAYVQVSMSVTDSGVEKREYWPFRNVRDSWSCYLLTLDPPITVFQGLEGLPQAFGISTFSCLLIS